MRVDSLMLTRMAEELAGYSEELDFFWDTLDGETDIMDFVGSILVELNECDANAIACADLAKRYTERKSALEARKQRFSKMLKTILMCTNQSKIPHPLATVSMRKGNESVMIINEKEIPSQLCRVTSTPDKTEIKKQLKAGVQIEGAELVTGPQTVSIRMK